MKTPLKVSLNSEISKVYDRYQYEQNYTMDLASFTRDPDDPENDEGASIVWALASFSRCNTKCTQKRNNDIYL